MPLVVPQIDDRNYDQILAEALARIPVHNPQWTNFNDSDPGVTLVQLFAFMTESLLYRSNLIPERNRLKFLTLLGVPLQAAASAQGLVAFNNPRGPLRTETLSAGLQLFAGQVPFRTQDGLDVLPIEGRVFYKSRLGERERAEVAALYEQLYASLQLDGAQLDYYETKPLEPPSSGAAFPIINLAEDTIDGLWVALLARSSALLEQTREAIANKVLTLGILPALTDASRILQPSGSSGSEELPNLIYEIPIGERLPIPLALRVPRYKVLDARPSGDLLAAPGVVQLPLPAAAELKLWENLEPTEQGVGNFPPSLEDTDIQDRLITWVRIRLRGAESENSTTNAATQLSTRLSWVGINAARVMQRVRVTNENLADGTGEPDQVVTLVNTPVIPGSVELLVNGQRWQEIDDLMAAESEVPGLIAGTPTSAANGNRASTINVYTVDRESGEIRFGDGLHGARPPVGAMIRARYDYGGGRQGNVGIGAINKSPLLPAGLKVSNPIPTWGGDEAESVAQAERRIPRYLQHRDRLVSKQDFEDITWRTPGVDLGRVEVLSLFHPQLPDVPAEGVVTVLVIPRYDAVQPEAPMPDQLFLDSVCSHLEPRRLITTELHLRGPEYVPIWLSIGIDVIPGVDIPTVREAVKGALRDFLSPLRGGFEENGWPLSQTVERLELWAVATRVPGVSKVLNVLLASQTGEPTERISITGLQLPRLAGLAVQVGTPLALSDLRGDLAAEPDTGQAARLVPVPVVPSEC